MEQALQLVTDDRLANLAQKRGALEVFLKEHGENACYTPLSNLQYIFRTEVRYAEMLCTAESEEEKKGIESARNERRLGNIGLFSEVLELTAQFKDLATIEFETSDDPHKAYLRALGRAATGHDATALAVITTAPLDLTALRQQMISTTE